MSTVEKLLGRLQRVKPRGQGKWFASCPTSAHKHGDRTPSLSVKELSDGGILLHCFAGCETEDVLSAVGMNFSDLYPPKHKHVLGERPGWSMRDILLIISDEVLVLLIAAEQVIRGKPLTEQDGERVALAVSRIRNALTVGGVYGRR